MTTIAGRLQHVRQRIVQACTEHGRNPIDIRLLAVSKTFPAEAVVEAIEAGQQAFGENYVQEGLAKIETLAARGLRPEWHCIGPLQSNKTREVAGRFDWVQSIDRPKIAQRLSQQRPEHLAPLNVCIQLNVDGGANKSGISPDQLPGLAREVAALPRLRLRGIMAIPEPAPGFAQQRELFERAARAYEQLRAEGFDLDTLSLGMSSDLEAAIAAGSTLVRIGTAIFGGR